jgi:hypothetical protein
MQIDYQDISTEHHLACPSCAATLFIARADVSEVPGGGFWLNDGDSIGLLFKSLTTAQQLPSGHLHALSVGCCRACNRDYFVAEARFMDGAWEDVEEYLLDNVDVGAQRNILCTTEPSAPDMPSTWLLSEYTTPGGPLHAHLFGPWALDRPEDVTGPHGVSSCGTRATASPWVKAADVLSWAWDAMRQRCLDAKASA